jgi:Fur family ferric uptake transcriptional regulator
LDVMKDLEAAFREFLESRSLKMTAQRSLVFNAFRKKKGHSSVEELYDTIKRKDPSIGQATVYRTMKLLSEAGLAREVDFGDGIVRYEHTYGRDHHDHLICERCGKKIEVLDNRIEALQEQLAGKHGFRLTGHKMYLYGICPDCRKKE